MCCVNQFAYSYPKEPLITAAKRSPITVPKRPLDSESNQYYLFCNTISLEFSPYRNFLIEAEFLLQDPSRLKLFISHEFKEFTENFIFPLVENWRKTGGQSPEALKKQNEAREKAGLDAELFVMNYEKKGSPRILE